MNLHGGDPKGGCRTSAFYSKKVHFEPQELTLICIIMSFFKLE